MDALIRYARAADGVSIAYFTQGTRREGIPSFVRMPAVPACHLGVEREFAAIREFDDNYIAPQTQLIRYDVRGMGLSERQIERFSLDAMVSDLEAVVTAAGAEQVVLHAYTWSTTIALAYAAKHPDKVARMVLMSPNARGVDAWNASFDSMLALSSADWPLACHTWLSSTMGWTEPTADMFTQIMLAGITQDAFGRFARDMREWDISGVLSSITAPTLVLHRRGFPFVTVESVQRLVAALPRGNLLLMDGTTIEAGVDGNAAMGRFLGARMPGPVSAAAATVIMFTDIVDSTALTERMGDAAFRERSRALDDAIRSIIRESGGTTIDAKTLGDGVLATFASASQAIRAALSLEAAADAADLQLHVGLHAGDVIREQDNVFGGAVNIAARISALAAPGEVLVSDIVRGLARTSAGVTFEDRGEHALKGVADAQRVFAVRALQR